MNEIFIDINENSRNIYLIDNKNIVEKYSENKDNPMFEGNIYVGKVQNVLPGMQAAFINIGIGKNAFIHLRDILPKKDVAFSKLDEQKNDIRKIIRPGDKILVQVTRDENYKKGTRVSKHISITGRFFVYMPNTPFIAISQKITNDKRKRELKEIISNRLPQDTGGIIRTNAENATNEEIIQDINNLVEKWEDVKKLSIDTFPKELYNAGGIIRKCLFDNIDKKIDRIIVNSESTKKKALEFLELQSKKVKIDIDENYITKFDFENQIRKSENRKIWLDCGGFITIDKTEALTAIDVNSGKFIGKNDFEETIFKVNEEATVEIAKQLRLRDIGGIIIIDYIDMHIPENKEKILKLIENEIKKDSSKVQIEGFTKLNLLEMTRKHVYSV